MQLFPSKTNTVAIKKLFNDYNEIVRVEINNEYAGTLFAELTTLASALGLLHKVQGLNPPEIFF